MSQVSNEFVLIRDLSQISLFEYNLQSIYWISFLTGFASRGEYEKRVEDFIQFHRELVDQSTDLKTALVAYYDFNRNEIKEDGTPRFVATTLRSWFSMFKQYFFIYI